MNTKKIIFATLAAFIVMFLADWLWFGVIFGEWFQKMMPANGMVNIPMHAFAELCLAFLMAIIYPFGFKGGSAMKEGAMFGFLIGLVYQLPVSIHMYASMGGSRRIVVFFIINGIVMGILGGIVVAMIYGKKTAAA